MIDVKKHIAFFFILFVLIIALFFSLFILNKSITQKHSAERKLKANLLRLNTLSKRSTLPPTRKTIMALKNQKEKLKVKYQNLLKLLQRSTIQRDVPVPLEFKEELLKTQNLLRERSLLWSITIPKAIGFDEYEGGIIPENSQIPVLVKNLELIKTILDLLIESKIITLERISKSKTPPVIYEGKKITFETFTFELSFTSSYRSLILFMSKINTSPIFFVIKRLNIRKLTDTSLKIHMKIEAILFNIQYEEE